MTIKKWVEFSQEVDVEIGGDEVALAFREAWGCASTFPSGINIRHPPSRRLRIAPITSDLVVLDDLGVPSGSCHGRSSASAWVKHACPAPHVGQPLSESSR
jgi:hypothetical protein